MQAPASRTALAFGSTLILAALILVVPVRPANAQIRAGGSVGYVFDEQTDFIQLGAEARGTLANAPVEINPRFTIQPVSGGSVIQADVNALYDLPLAKTSTFLPYAGLGLAVQHIGGGGGTHVGYNLVWGTELNLRSALQPFAQFQYTVIVHEGNPAVIAVGLLYKFGASGK
jgi:hypothetical protein